MPTASYVVLESCFIAMLYDVPQPIVQLIHVVIRIVAPAAGNDQTHEKVSWVCVESIRRTSEWRFCVTLAESVRRRMPDREYEPERYSAEAQMRSWSK